METLYQLINNANTPILSALILGLLTAISPCPLATNITATAYIAKTLDGKRKVLLSGLLYMLGLATSYSGIAMLILFGASKFYVAKFFQSNGEKLVGPVMLIIGLVMLNIIKLDFLGKTNFSEKLQDKFKDKGLLGSFLLGMLFAMAFCPYSGAMYFGILIPMSMKSEFGFILPLFYSIGASSLVLFFTLLIAYSIRNVGKYFKMIQQFEKKMRLVAGLLFIVTGLYYILIYLKVITL